MNRETDNLEKYISENRHRFERYTPPHSLRNRVFRATHAGRKMVIGKQLMMAATIALVVAIPSLMIVGNKVSGLRNASLSGASPELNEIKIYYEDMMSSVFSKADKLFATYPGLEHEVKADLTELEKIGSQLMADLKDNIDNREVVEALIRNYMIRIQMLEDLLSNMKEEETKTVKPKNHEI